MKIHLMAPPTLALVVMALAPRAGQATSSSLRGIAETSAAASSSSSSDFDVDMSPTEIDIANPADILTCIQFTDKGDCEGVKTSDGAHCAWCSSKMLQKSFCATPDAGDAMKQFILDLQCGGDGNAVEMYDEGLGINPADLLKCIQETEKGGCDGTDTSDGGHCTWCSSDMLQKSFCTTSDAGDAMKQFIQDLMCDSDGATEEYDEGLGINPADLLKCIQETEKGGCDGTDTSDGGHCTWCSSDMLQKSFCTTSDAGNAMKQFIQDLMCDGDGATEEYDEGLGINPVDLLKCIQKTEKGGCDGTDTSDGGHCAWCSSDMLQKSFCTTSDAGDAMKQFIQDLMCDSDGRDFRLPSREGEAMIPLGDNDLATLFMADTGPFDSSCFGASALDESACSDAKDEVGKGCVWCSSAAGNFGLCLTEHQAKMAVESLGWLSCLKESGRISMVH